MYIWNIGALKKKLASERFSDKELIPYIVLYAALSVVGGEVSQYLSYEVDAWDYIGSVGAVIMTIAGTVYCYKCNGGKNGTNFLLKYFSIGFVIGVRFFVYLIPIGFLLGVYTGIVFGQEGHPTNFLDTLVMSCWYGIQYLLMAKHIGDTVVQ